MLSLVAAEAAVPAYELQIHKKGCCEALTAVKVWYGIEQDTS